MNMNEFILILYSTDKMILWDSTMRDPDIGIQVKRHSQTGFYSYRLYINNWTNFMEVYEIITFHVRDSYNDNW